MILIKMMGSLSQGGFLFTFRMKEVTENYGVRGLWSVYPNFLANNPSVSGTAPYRYFCHLLNFGMGLALIVPQIKIFAENHLSFRESWPPAILVISLLIIVICNSQYTKNDLNTKIFLPTLRENWEKAKLET